MKKTSVMLFAVALLLMSVRAGLAATIMGEITNIDDKTSMYTIKTEKGKEVKVHVNETTKKTGDVKVGAHVKVDETKGHAKSIEVEEAKK